MLRQSRITISNQEGKKAWKTERYIHIYIYNMFQKKKNLNQTMNNQKENFDFYKSCTRES